VLRKKWWLSFMTFVSSGGPEIRAGEARRSPAVRYQWLHSTATADIRITPEFSQVRLRVARLPSTGALAIPRSPTSE
jgi:hypothetical protein